MAGLIHNLTIETASTEEEAAEGLEAALETQEMEVEGYGGREGEEEGGGNQRALEAFEFLTQDPELSGSTLVYALNGFNELSRLAMLWTGGPPRLAEEKLCPMLVAIERKSHSSQPAVPHSPQHRQAAQLVEPITGVNERSAGPLSFLSEELRSSSAC